MAETRTASCACGKVEVTLKGDPEIVTACNCTQCQKQTGSAFGLGCYFKKAQAISIAGPHKAFTKTSDSGRSVEAHFCTECGSTVFWYAVVRPDQIGVAVGCFADPEFPAPMRAIWMVHKMDWVEFPSAIPHMERQRT